MAHRTTRYELTRDELFDFAESIANRVASTRLDRIEETLDRILDALDDQAEWLTPRQAAGHDSS